MTPYDPSEEEIAAACEQIRAGWSEHERRKRMAWAVSEPVTVAAVEIEVEDSST